MALSEEVRAALSRLQTFYNSQSISDANPGGFGNWGHTVNFDPYLRDFTTVGQAISALATEVDEGNTALQDAVTSAAQSAADAYSYANTIDPAHFATFAQGEKADSAVQPSDLAPVATSGDYGDLDNLPALGSVAAIEITDYATAAQGALADTAVQPEDIGGLAAGDNAGDVPYSNATSGLAATSVQAAIDEVAGANVFSGSYNDLSDKPTLGTAAAADAADFATAAQGEKADTAVQPSDLGFQQIGSPVALTGTSVTITDLPQDGSELLFVFEGASHNNGTTTYFYAQFSNDNGTTWSSDINSVIPTSGGIAASGTLYGTAQFLNYAGDIGTFRAGISAITGSLQSAMATSVRETSTRHSGGCDAIRFVMAAGAFDAGTVTVFKR